MTDQRYLRQIKLEEIGEAGQKRLAEASVLVVGVGGLGSVVATYLNGAGIGTIGLIDSDVVSVTNLHRQFIYTESETGQPKAPCAARFLAARSSHTRIREHAEALNEANAGAIISVYDVVVDCTDNFAVRFVIDDTCRRQGKSWVHGAIGAFDGRVAVFTAGARTRFADLYPERDYLCALPHSSGGVVGPMPGVIGSLQAMETIKLIVGIDGLLAGKLFTINILTLETHLIDL